MTSIPHTRAWRALIALLLLTASLPVSAAAQRGSDQPMWLADAYLEGVSRESPNGYDFFVTGSIEVGSSSGPVSGVLVQVVLTGPAGEQIHTEAVTDRGGVASIVTSVPGPGNYGSTLYDMHGSGYYYDPRQNHVAVPAVLLAPPDGIVAPTNGHIVYTGTVDRITWFKPGGYVNPAKTLISWEVVGAEEVMFAVATDATGYVYVGSGDGYGNCLVTKYTWYGSPASGFQPISLACPYDNDYRFSRFALATTTNAEVLIARNGPPGTVLVDRYGAGGAHVTGWEISLAVEQPGIEEPGIVSGFGDIAVDSQNRVLLTYGVFGWFGAGVLSAGVKMMSNTGAPLFDLEDGGHQPDQFRYPRGIDVDAQGNVFVLNGDDSWGGFNELGPVLYSDVKHLVIEQGALVLTDTLAISELWTSPNEAANPFAVDANGNVYVGYPHEDPSWHGRLEVYTAPTSSIGWLLAGGISSQYTPAYRSVASIDVTP